VKCLNAPRWLTDYKEFL